MACWNMLIRSHTSLITQQLVLNSNDTHKIIFTRSSIQTLGNQQNN